MSTRARAPKPATAPRSAPDHVGRGPTPDSDRPWLAHYDPGVPAEVEIPPIPVDGLLRGSAERAPDRTAMVFFGARTSYAQLDRAADRFAHVLRSMGVEKGDRVSLHLPTSPAFVIAFMGAMRAGALAVPMNPLFVERELGILLAETEPRVSVTVDLLVSRLGAVEEAAGGVTSLATMAASASNSFLPSDTPFLKAEIPLPTSPIRPATLPRPNRTRTTTATRISWNGPIICMLKPFHAGAFRPCWPKC